MLYRALLVILVSVPILGCTQGDAPRGPETAAAAPSLEGVWRVAEIVTTGANAATTPAHNRASSFSRAATTAI